MPPPEEPTPALSRRALLAGLAGVGLGALGAGCSSSPPPRRTPPTTRARTTTTTAPSGPELPTAGWVRAENDLPGTLDWIVTGSPVPHAIEGFADHVSAAAGDTVGLYVNARAATFHVEAYRMGWYQGLGARLVWRSPEVPARVQPAPAVAPGTNTVECRWERSLTVPVDTSWPTGNYLLKLVGSDGQQQYVPLTVRDDASTAAVLIQNAVTTWQAYNLYGGYSLYLGPQGGGQAYATRARVVSFDRPYALATVDWANGATDWLGNEFPFVMWAERVGLDVAYWTDVDLHEHPERVLHHRMLVSLGHDEYWSRPMFDAAVAAVAGGTNIAVLGANACFRHIRFENSPTGADRRVVCYKDPREDPLYGSDNAEVTSNWPDAPSSRPESQWIGNMYQSNPVDASLVVSDAGAWGLAGTGMKAGDSLPHVVGSEFDAYRPGPGVPDAVEIWCHSPLVVRGIASAADVTYYTRPGAGGVFATGTNWWVNKLSDNQGRFNPALVAAAIPEVTGTLTTITKNVVTVLGSGPAGTLKPSTANWRSVYPPGSKTAPVPTER